MEVPLLNTVILLSSGFTVVGAHKSIINNNYAGFIDGLISSIFLGVVFTLFQVYEYVSAEFGIHDSVYGSVFYMMTGFHGFHVIVGTLFLIVCLVRGLNFHFKQQRHFGFEAAG